MTTTTAIATAVQNLVDQTAAGLASGHDACGNPLRRNVRIIGGDKVTVRVRDTEVGTVVTNRTRSVRNGAAHGRRGRARASLRPER